MAFQELASELIHQIYDNLTTISDVLNLSLTSRRFHFLLRSTHKLSILFAAADRDIGPINDITMLLTHNHTQPAHVKRNPPLSYSLLRQIMVVGSVGKRFTQLYPSKRWDTDFINRRALTQDEAYCVRRALYRFWLYAEAFHNRAYPRTYRLLRGSIEERCQLLRNWTNQELFELEDIRSVLEDILTFQICPTDGMVRARAGKDYLLVQWQHSCTPRSWNLHQTDDFNDLFHNSRDDDDVSLSPLQARTTKMEGWGDEISQYHTVQSMLKLNPSHIMWLHDHAVYKWQVEVLVHELGEDWFWNNGQTLSDTWSIVLTNRGLDVESIRGDILGGNLGAAISREKEQIG